MFNPLDKRFKSNKDKDDEPRLGETNIMYPRQNPIRRIQTEQIKSRDYKNRI